MQGIIDTIVNAYVAVMVFFTDLGKGLKSFFDAVIQSLANIFQMVIDFYTSAFESIGSFFSSIPDTVKSYWDAFITYAESVWPWLKSFFQFIYTYVKWFADTCWVYFVNVFKSLYYALVDLPILLLKKLFGAFSWLLDWVYQSCSYCIGGGSGSGSGSMSVFSSIWSSISPSVLYCAQQSGVQEALQVLTCGLVVFVSLKSLMLVLKAL